MLLGNFNMEEQILRNEIMSVAFVAMNLLEKDT